MFARPQDGRRQGLVHAILHSGLWKFYVFLLIYSIGIATLFPVVPTLVTNGWASIAAGEEIDCQQFTPATAPVACRDAHATAVTWTTWSGFVSNCVLTFLCAPVVGKMSDLHGRKPFMLLGIFLGIIPIGVLYGLVNGLVEVYWYYPASALNGIVSSFALSLTAVADLMEQRHRAAAVGLLTACFSLGILVGPGLGGTLSTDVVLNIALFGMAITFLYVAIFIPETAAAPTKRRAAARAAQEAAEAAAATVGSAGGGGGGGYMGPDLRQGKLVERTRSVLVKDQRRRRGARTGLGGVGRGAGAAAGEAARPLLSDVHASVDSGCDSESGHNEIMSAGEHDMSVVSGVDLPVALITTTMPAGGISAHEAHAPGVGSAKTLAAGGKGVGGGHTAAVGSVSPSSLHLPPPPAAAAALGHRRSHPSRHDVIAEAVAEALAASGGPAAVAAAAADFSTSDDSDDDGGRDRFGGHRSQLAGAARAPPGAAAAGAFAAGSRNAAGVVVADVEKGGDVGGASSAATMRRLRTCSEEWSAVSLEEGRLLPDTAQAAGSAFGKDSKHAHVQGSAITPPQPISTMPHRSTSATQGSTPHDDQPLDVTTPTIAATATAVFSVDQGWRVLLKDPWYARLAFVSIIVAMAAEGAQDLLIQYLQLTLGFNTADQAHLFVVAAACGLTVKTLLLPHLVSRIGELNLMLVGLASFMVQDIALALATSKGMALGAVALGSLASFCYPAMLALQTSRVAPGQYGAVSGALQAISALASGTGPVAFAFLFSAVTRSDSPYYFPGLVWYMAAALTVVAMAVVLTMRSVKPHVLVLPTSRAASSANLAVHGTSLGPGSAEDGCCGGRGADVTGTAGQTVDVDGSATGGDGGAGIPGSVRLGAAQHDVEVGQGLRGPAHGNGADDDEYGPFLADDSPPPSSGRYWIKRWGSLKAAVGFPRQAVDHWNGGDAPGSREAAQASGAACTASEQGAVGSAQAGGSDHSRSGIVSSTKVSSTGSFRGGRDGGGKGDIKEDGAGSDKDVADAGADVEQPLLPAQRQGSSRKRTSLGQAGTS